MSFDPANPTTSEIEWNLGTGTYDENGKSWDSYGVADALDERGGPWFPDLDVYALLDIVDDGGGSPVLRSFLRADGLPERIRTL